MKLNRLDRLYFKKLRFDGVSDEVLMCHFRRLYSGMTLEDFRRSLEEKPLSPERGINEAYIQFMFKSFYERPTIEIRRIFSDGEMD
jgi:hypothetical protein